MNMFIWALIGVGIVAGFMISVFCSCAMVALVSICRSLIEISQRLDYRITNLERR